MVELEFRRGKEVAILKGNILLGPLENIGKSFRIFCQELGADAAFSTPLNGKSDLNFEDENIIAFVEKPTKKLIEELENNKNVSLLCTDLTNISNLLKISKKPVLLYTNHNNLEDIPEKISGVIVKFEENTEADTKLVKNIKKTQDKVLVEAKFETPEDMYNFMRDSDSDGIVIGSFAVYKPTIFEQAENYFEKGYYNKLTRKRREKVVARFEEIFKQYESDSEGLAEYNQRFLEE